MRKKLLVIHKGQFDNFPPLMSVKNAMNNCGYKVDVLTAELKNFKLFDENEKFYVVRNKRKIPIFSSLFWFLKFLFKLNGLLKKKEYQYVWVEGGDTLALFGWLFKSKSNRVFQLSELYDKVPLYKFLIGLNIKKFNKIVVPEINRAYIIKTIYNLPSLPFVLPNKPNYHEMNNVFDENTSKYLIQIKDFARNRKIILYQGLIATDRQFKGVVDFVIKNKDEYCLILMGKDTGYLPMIDIDKKAIIHIGFLLPPNHLEITKLAYICILAYDTTSLNKVYCAPNKIWEYTKYNKPMLSQDLPGINMLFAKYGIGSCCDVMDVRAVEKAVRVIEDNYISIVSNAKKFYNSIEVNDIVENILIA